MHDRNRFLLAAVASVLATVPAKSSEDAEPDIDSVYESLTDIDIGQVFFSPRQRLDMDERRRVRPSSFGKTGKSPVRRKTNPKGAGYIISSSGRTKVYSGQDFISAVVKDEMAFPGDVKVSRTSPRAPNPVPIRADAPQTDNSDANK